jgi:hypothetical protein
VILVNHLRGLGLRHAQTALLVSTHLLSGRLLAQIALPVSIHLLLGYQHAAIVYQVNTLQQCPHHA